MTTHHLDAVKKAVPHLGYSKSYLNTVRAALNKAPKVYNIDGPDPDRRLA